jgi:membrane protein implicated in regulation of membrane protease activity
MMVRFVPGFVAAVIAFAAAKLLSLVASLPMQTVVFLLTYIIVAILVDFAMRRYGKPR